ncbi:hypothetical protein H257_19219 [Aphanomyces astaci]|uniref:Tc1-like transposase DDE domain-containing protein n=1 Tax=Aphanomyces astaci TaxID=112090 RepID=W4F8R0_APHAT|nr:hypothetical protein H257_19219 [Aphanomyces astaci]ETV63847.1 hypothetical protein H257_19219 [Aphanomyces astaci]|eukprot:XP_009846668.1 hypothetical protein H257_19219 [Aphanomyces astaci]
MRTPHNFLLHLNESILPELTEATARRWMVHAGYKFGSWRKDVYVDGHERQDVVEYRKVFCSTWLSLSERMASFSGEAMDILESPNDVSQKQVVWVTHDESIFYANDDGEMKSILEETIVAAGHVCLFFPKYHCELNPIESYWGAAKRHARSNEDKILPHKNC